MGHPSQATAAVADRPGGARYLNRIEEVRLFIVPIEPQPHR